MTTTPEYPEGKLMPYPSYFTTRDIETNGATLHTRIGGSGPAVRVFPAEMHDRT